MSTPTYYPNETVSWEYEFKNESGDRIDPDSISCYIYDPDDSVKGTITLDKVSTGLYDLDYNLPSDAADGIWYIVLSIVSGSYKKTDLLILKVEKAAP